jgi:hypothetical protein
MIYMYIYFSNNLALPRDTLVSTIGTQIQVSEEQPLFLIPCEDVFYLNCELLFPAQTRISNDGVIEKIAKAKERQKVAWDEQKAKWQPKYDDGRSILSTQEAIPVVKAPFGFIPIDGHHDIRASLDLGASTVPVRVIEDLSFLSTAEFWEQAEKNDWAYLYAVGGEKMNPIESFQDLVDDPNRRFAGIMARKYNLDGTSRGTEYPLWIKIDKDIPFIEFKIADVLWNRGVIYSSGDEHSVDFVENVRQILLEANIEGLRVVPTRLHYSQIEI